jgi:hypothetical protein
MKSGAADASIEAEVSTVARPEDTTLIEEIATLVAEPAPSDPARLIARIEHTLTAGYARALALEAERLRLERRIAAVALELEQGDAAEQQDELKRLALRVSDADGDLRRLRTLLGSLRDRARELRKQSATAA